MGRKKAIQDEETTRKRQSLIQKDISHLLPEEIGIQFVNQVSRLHRTDPALSATERTAINDEISIWLVKLIKYQKLNAFKNDELHIIDALQFAFQTVVDYLGSDRGPADTTSISNALNSSLTNLLAKTLTYVGALSNGDTILHEWLEERVIYKLSKSSKNLYYFVETFLKYGMDSTWLIEGRANFLQTTIGILDSSRNDPLANSMARAVVALFKKKYDNDVVKWINTWIRYIPSDMENDSNIIKYLLPQFFKVTEKAYPVFMKMVVNLDVYGSRIQLAFRCVGQNLRLDATEQLDKSSSLVKEWFSDIDPEVRLLAFKYVTGSTKASAPIEPSIYDLIKETYIIQSFQNEFENLEIRNLFCSTLNLFIRRIKDSVLSQIKANPTQGVPEGLHFISWLLDSIVLHYLLPSSTYPQMNTALNIYSAIIIHNFTEIPQTSVFDPYKADISKLLFFNLSNNYENIRQECYKLLQKFPLDKLSLLLENEVCQYLMDDITKLCDIRGRRSEAYANTYAFASEFILKTNCMDFAAFFDKMKAPIADYRTFRIHGILTYFRMMVGIHNNYIDNYLSQNIVQLNIQLWESFHNSLSEISEHYSEHMEDDITATYHWKVIKEANALLMQFAVENSLSYFNLEQAVKLIAEQLENIKHRGVFLSVYPSFVALASLYFSHPNSKSANNDPQRYLESCLNQVVSKTQLKSRRSAGLPYIICGLLSLLETSSSKTSRDEMTQNCFERLFEVARSLFEYDAKNDLPQVHAFNILKQLYSEGLIPSVFLDKHLSPTLDLCLSLFTSENWSVRNCSVMLFGVLQRYLFPSGKQVSSVVIFNRYPDIKEILIKHLTTGKEFPVVSILNNVVNSSNDGTLDLLQHKLVDTLDHPHWKIRQMAARALASNISPNKLIEFLEGGIENDFDSQNKLHGIMLTIYEIVKRIKAELYGQDIPATFIARFGSFYVKLIQDETASNLVSRWAIMVATVRTLEALEFADETTMIMWELYVFDLVNEESNGALDGLKEAYVAELVKLLLQFYMKYKLWTKIESLSLACISNSRYSKASQAAIAFNLKFHGDIVNSQEYVKSLSDLLEKNVMSDYIECKFVEYLSLLALQNENSFKTLTQSSSYSNSNSNYKHSEGLECRLLYLESIISPNTVQPRVQAIEEHLAPESPEVLRILAAKTLSQLMSAGNPRVTSLMYELLTDDESEIREVACQSFMSACQLSYTPNATYLMYTLVQYPIQWDWEYLLSDNKRDYWIHEATNSFNLNTVFDFEPSNIHRNELDSMVMISRLNGYSKPKTISTEQYLKVIDQLLEKYGENALQEPAVFLLVAFAQLASDTAFVAPKRLIPRILASTIDKSI